MLPLRSKPMVIQGIVLQLWSSSFSCERSRSSLTNLSRVSRRRSKMRRRKCGRRFSKTCSGRSPQLPAQAKTHSRFAPSENMALEAATVAPRCSGERLEKVWRMVFGCSVLDCPQPRLLFWNIHGTAWSAVSQGVIRQEKKVLIVRSSALLPWGILKVELPEFDREEEVNWLKWEHVSGP